MSLRLTIASHSAMFLFVDGAWHGVTHMEVKYATRKAAANKYLDCHQAAAFLGFAEATESDEQQNGFFFRFEIGERPAPGFVVDLNLDGVISGRQ